MSISNDNELALYQAFLDNRDTRLIAPAEDGAPNVEFRFGGEWRECRIWEGYLDASLILLKEALQDAPRSNNLVFPALFSLRHAMEVALKWHIRYAGGTIPKSAGHDLGVLIHAFRKTADDLDDEASYVSDYFLECISELASLDPRSVTFRYSSEIDGSPIKLPSNGWNLRHLYFAVSELIVYLDGLSNSMDLSRDERYQHYIRGE
ncbi:MAG: hypothetical protein K5872_03435 [Rhizobiaceae bacterium]|nr:hypothetical protein [Rhizobiaceae bacterium]MCV0405263.1 hypothetical protein [Rhizobiaceae bacterium]